MALVIVQNPPIKLSTAGMVCKENRANIAIYPDGFSPAEVFFRLYTTGLACGDHGTMQL